MTHSAFKIDYKSRVFNLKSEVTVTSNFDKNKSGNTILTFAIPPLEKSVDLFESAQAEK